MNSSAAPKSLRVEQEPYPHLRDDDGCVLARDYEHTDKTAYIVKAVNSHEALLAALNGLVGLVQLVRSRPDCPVEIKQALTDHYRLDDAFAALASASPEGTQPCS